MKSVLPVVQAFRPLARVSEAAVQAADANDYCTSLPIRRTPWMTDLFGFSTPL
jgi:hypothetical protein